MNRSETAVNLKRYTRALEGKWELIGIAFVLLVGVWAFAGMEPERFPECTTRECWEQQPFPAIETYPNAAQFTEYPEQSRLYITYTVDVDPQRVYDFYIESLSKGPKDKPWRKVKSKCALAKGKSCQSYRSVYFSLEIAAERIPGGTLVEMRIGRTEPSLPSHGGP